MSMTGRAIRLTSQESTRLRADPDAAEDIAYDEEELALTQGRLLDVDKSWHGLHFLLNGRPWEVTGRSGAAGMAVLGGEALGPDLGYGPARLLTTSQASAVAAGLAEVEELDLRSRYDPATWEENDIYPSVWGHSAWAEELAPGLAALRDFYARAVAAGQEVLLALV